MSQSAYIVTLRVLYDAFTSFRGVVARFEGGLPKAFGSILLPSPTRRRDPEVIVTHQNGQEYTKRVVESRRTLVQAIRNPKMR